MLKRLFASFIIILFFVPSYAGAPDSVYLFAYSSLKNGGRNGLHFAWSRDGHDWNSIGNEFAYVRSDYGRWGSQKRMISPVLFQGADGIWHCVWALNEEVNQFAHAASADLINWGRQTYPYLPEGTRFADPDVAYDQKEKSYAILFTNKTDLRNAVTTKDFKSFTAVSATEKTTGWVQKKTVAVKGNNESGTVHKVPWYVIEQLLRTYQTQQYRVTLEGEDAKKDSVRFATLKPLEVSVQLKPAASKPISSMLTGVFFEDINYAADGGLYAELIQNRDFEYTLSDKESRDKNWNETHSWSLTGNDISWKVDSINPTHPNNSHYALLETKKAGGMLVNSGFDGVAVKAGETYRFSVSLKAIDPRAKSVTVLLLGKEGKTLAQTTINGAGSNWKKFNVSLIASATDGEARLALQPREAGILAIDMVSLFPAKTFKGRVNGLRADLAQKVAEIRPRFVRFPGGCVAHGDGIGNIYHWKNTIGQLEARKPQRNLWGYHQTAGLGYFEYFQFCEDIGAEPVPVVAAGVPCQNSGVGGGGQQGGIPMAEMDQYVQDVLDLIEYANGEIKTTWGRRRAESGHPAPFNLKYIGIGNEDLITDVFEERYLMICKAVKAKYPEIVVIGTVGPFFEGTDYREGWAIADREKIEMVDEHYYQTPGWFINNQDFYDSYDRSKSKVYLGEYASRGTTLYNALSEALYLTGVERNADIVTMASYAPLLAKEGHTQWNPDLIYFNNTEVKSTVSYEVQKLYGVHAGDVYIPAAVSVATNDEAVKKRIGLSVVRDSKSGDIVVKLVNMLPVATTLKIDLGQIIGASTDATKIVLKGKPGDKQLLPEQSVMKLQADGRLSLDAYSFTVLRFKGK
ncbi:MAG: alpha-L-arabinofuranosidase C-terminal domain-containing protein [Chitinophagaceae bacterium]